MYIYPYVYRLNHKKTNEFYIGCRLANYVPAELDLGNIYFTSSKYVKNRFNEFDFLIIAVFFNQEDAYNYEQQLIHESWGCPGLLNRSCFHGKKKFIGVAGIPHTEEHNKKISASMTGRPKTEEHNKKVSEAKLGIRLSEEHKLNLSISHQGNKHSEETKNKMRERRHTKETKDKMSKSRTGKHHSEETLKKLSNDKKGKSKPKLVCRIHDRKEMDLGNWGKYMKRLSLISVEDT